ncbi:MAG TPA: hypothetical protein VFE51_01720 [Verrucomicrobiae bacterium]|nr:hypothetical protein [Verrucomicrobiae bacterium]
MSKDSSLFSGLLVFGICVPLAIFLGYLLATPLDPTSMVWIVMTLFLLLSPLLLKWHHEALIISWNLALVAFFLPGAPAVGYLVGGLSLVFSVAKRALLRQPNGIHCPSVSIPLILLAGVVLITAQQTGGIHARALGSDAWGAMRYFQVLGAIAGYFAFISQPIAPHRAKLMAGLFFLSGVTSVIPVLIALAGPGFQFLLRAFSLTSIASADTSIFSLDLQRFVGVMFMSQAVCCFMMLRYGIRGILDWNKPWRFISFVGMIAFGLLGGFRSFLVVFALVSLVQFYFEGLLRSRFFVWLSLGGVVGLTLLFAFADQLPMPVQRSISFLPVQINPAVRRDAASTWDWRVEMWRVILPQVPRYLLLGKGFNFDGTDYYLTTLGAQRGMSTSYDAALISSDYHQGILTLIIPFGIWGFSAFSAFCGASLRVLYRNYRYSPPELRSVNTFLLSYFIGRLIFYFIFYGEFFIDLGLFTGAIGLSLSLNGGIRQEAEAPAPAPAASREDWRLQPV